MSNTRCHCLNASLFAAVMLGAMSSGGTCTATEVLVHYEYECLSDNGCPHSSRTATEADFRIEIYPSRTGFDGYFPGDTEDITVPIEGFSLISDERFALGARAFGVLRADGWSWR